jgi:dihydrofolate reductase
MRKLIVLEFVSLYGVIQAPGAPEEDTSGGFEYGGWTVPYSEEVMDQTMSEQMRPPFELLLGRKTYDIWAPYWPQHENVWPGINSVTKYVASHSPFTPEWSNSVLLQGDIAAEVGKLKQQDAPNLHVYGSGNLVQTLLKHDLVDELWLKIFPVTLGQGKRLFDGGSIPAAFKLTSSTVSTTGVFIANYARAGDVQTGSFV